MQQLDIVCVTTDPSQLVRLSQELSGMGNLILFEDIERAESKVPELNTDAIFIIELAEDFSYEFLEKYSNDFRWIGLCREENFSALFSKLDNWDLGKLLPIPRPENALRERVENLLNKENSTVKNSEFAIDQEHQEHQEHQEDQDVMFLQEELVRTRREAEAQQAELRQLTSMLEENLLQAESAQDEIVPLMSALINLRINEPLDVAIRPAKLAMNLASNLKVDIKKRKDLYRAGLLHNIGMIAMPDDILNKPYNHLSPEQQEQFNELVLRGQAMLDSIPTFEDIALTVRHMYERYDGSGFPDGLAGEDIPLYSRILVPAIDFFELQKGVYFEKKHTAKEALVFILDRSGSRYDPKVVDYLSECLAEMDDSINRVIDHISLNQAVVGMELASSIRVKENMTLLRGGKILTEEVINKLGTVQQDINQTIMLNVYRDSLHPEEQDAA